MNDLSPIQKKWPQDERYIVFDDGRIMGPSGRILKPRKHMHGYIRMSAIVEGRAKDFYAHRIVCETFHGAPASQDMQVDHINGVRDDNRSSNLRWVTKAENLSHRQVLSGEDHPNTKLTDRQVRDVRAAVGSHGDIASIFGVSRELVRDIKSGKDRKNA